MSVKQNVEALLKGKKLREEEVERPERDSTTGPLEDGGHIYPRCSNCDAILMDIWVTRPHECLPGETKPAEWKVKANCPFCGDASFTTIVQGGFHVGGYGEIKEDDPEDDFPSTKIDSSDLVNDTFVFKIIKANSNAKPLKR